MLLEKNLEIIRERIALACSKVDRDPSSVRLIAVSKTQPTELITKALALGQLDFGENRVQEMVQKANELPEGLIWHMIGTLQTNKIRLMAPFVSYIHSISTVEALREVSKRAGLHKRVINVLIQINISKESQKSGCEPDELKRLLLEAKMLDGLSVCGLMGIASLEQDPEKVREQFRLLRALKEEHQPFTTTNISLHELSMGMSHDMEVAIEEGATMVRVGSALFGER